MRDTTFYACALAGPYYSPESRVQVLQLPLPPCHEKVLPGTLASKLQLVYKQLYPTKQISHFPYFYREYGRIVLAGNVIGSVKPGPNNSSSSVIMAFWPSSGDSFRTIDYTHMRVGEVQYYIKHTIKVSTTIDSGPSHQVDETHLFAYVSWKKQNPHYNWFGISALLRTGGRAGCMLLYPCTANWITMCLFPSPCRYPNPFRNSFYCMSNPHKVLCLNNDPCSHFMIYHHLKFLY